MQKQLVLKLQTFAEEVAGRFSKPDREFNYDSETFEVMQIKPLSEHTAVVYFKKSPSKKFAMAFFYHTNGGGGRWNYFFPTDSHALGMGRVADLLFEVEQRNFPLNKEN